MLTAAQLQMLKTDLAANTNTVIINGTATAINVVPHGAQNAQTIADWYNLTASPAYQVIRTDAPVVDINNNVTWPNYTPNPAVTGANAAQATACSMYCQGKQFNLQLLLQGRTTFDATKATQTAGLKDATTNLPSGASFNNQNAGWQNIVPVLNRACTNGEKLFVVANTTVAVLNDGVSARGTTGNPDLMTFEGQLSGQDILNAWAA